MTGETPNPLNRIRTALSFIEYRMVDDTDHEWMREAHATLAVVETALADLRIALDNGDRLLSQAGRVEESLRSMLAAAVNRAEDAEEELERLDGALDQAHKDYDDTKDERDTLRQALERIAADETLHRLPGVNSDGSVSTTLSLAQSVARAVLAGEEPT